MGHIEKRGHSCIVDYGAGGIVSFRKATQAILLDGQCSPDMLKRVEDMRDRVGPGHLAAMSCVQTLVQKEGGAAVVSRAAFAECCAALGVDVTLVIGLLLDKLDE